jgi:hypothetical protein
LLFNLVGPPNPNKLEVAHTTSATKSVRYCALAIAIPPSFFPFAFILSFAWTSPRGFHGWQQYFLGDRLTRTGQKQIGGRMEGWMMDAAAAAASDG